MNASTEHILKVLAQAPTKPGRFTHQKSFLGRNEDTMRALLVELVAEGLATEYKDLFSITAEGRAQLAAATDRMPEPRTWGSHATKGMAWKAPTMGSVRPGAGVAFGLPSRGVAC